MIQNENAGNAQVLGEIEIEAEIGDFDSIITEMKESGAEFITLSACEGEDGRITLYYYFRREGKMAIIKVLVEDDFIPSLYSSYQKSDFIEREIYNIFRIKFLGHPNLEKIKKLEDSSVGEIVLDNRLLNNSGETF